MKRFKYLLAVITICLLASCGNSSSMQGYVTEKMAEYSRTCVKFNRLTLNEMTLIVNAEVEKTEKLLAERDVTIWLTQAARVWLAENARTSLASKPISNSVTQDGSDKEQKNKNVNVDRYIAG